MGKLSITTEYYCYGVAMRVTSKGQVTIPQEVRRRLGIEPGSEVDFNVVGETVQIVRRSSGAGAAIVAGLRGRATDRTMTTDEIMALTRGE